MAKDPSVRKKLDAFDKLMPKHGEKKKDTYQQTLKDALKPMKQGATRKTIGDNVKKRGSGNAIG